MTGYGVVVWLHVLAAAAWVGSMIFFATVIVPIVRRMEPAAAAAVVRDVGRRFRVFGWVALGTLLITGAFNLSYRGVTWDAFTSGAFWETSFGRVLSWKLGLVAVVIIATACHELMASPSAAGPRDPSGASRVRRRASLLGRFVMVVSLAILFLAVVLVRGLV